MRSGPTTPAARIRRDHYEVLGVPRDAGTEEIRTAFHRLARELHPDVSPAPDAEDRFREVSAAYTTLSSASARSLYDHFGFEDGDPLRPSRLVGEVELQVFEAARGARRLVRVVGMDTCERCEGSGSASAEPRVCLGCRGKGTVRVSAGLGFGRWLRVAPCDECGGAGRFEAPCPSCGGTGETSSERMLRVRIPAGVENGVRLRVAGEPQEAHLLVRVLPLPPDSRVVRYSAAALLVVATVFLIFLLSQT